MGTVRSDHIVITCAPRCGLGESGLKSEIQSVEVSFFVQATEDRPRLVDSVKARLSLGTDPSSEELQGHFGNRILRVTFRLVGEEAQRVFVSLASSLRKDHRSDIEGNLGAFMDEHKALYIRLDKQELLDGRYVLATKDPVRIKVKPRAFLMKGDATAFYHRVMGPSER
ncbi:MAG: hypothetical protein OK422_00845 [Thaumarchaeota archaeon]|nr:hypothetical protein [Nitrososphaerota archaeon]